MKAYCIEIVHFVENIVLNSSSLYIPRDTIDTFMLKCDTLNISLCKEVLMNKQPSNQVVLQCPNCGARAGLNSGKTHCSQPGHSMMVPAWFSTGKLLTEKERQEQNLFDGKREWEKRGSRRIEREYNRSLFVWGFHFGHCYPLYRAIQTRGSS